MVIGADLRSHSLGLSQRRAEWLVKWISQVAAAKTIRMASFEEELGRTLFVVEALEHERTFLGPLYKFFSHYIPETQSDVSCLI